MLFVAMSAVVVMAAAVRQRAKSFQVSTNDGYLSISVGEPLQRNVAARFSTQLSEFMVIDADCGKRVAGCSAYCLDATFGFLYCSPLCRRSNDHTTSLTCRHETERYDSTKSSMSALADGPYWSKTLYNIRPLQGRIFRDRIRLDQLWRSARPEMEVVGIFEAPFVSALLYDYKLGFEASAVFGLRPGANSAALGFLNGLGAQRAVLSFARARRWDVMKAFIDTKDLYMTFGAEDKYRCVGWKWTPAPEFAVVADRVDFMGVEFRNVLLVLDFNNIVYHVSPQMADSLVEGKVLSFLREEGGVKFYKYLSGHQTLIRFFDSTGQQFLRLGHQTNRLGWSPIAVDRLDISSDPRAEQLIFNMGTAFLEQSCLAYDYESQRIGFGGRRPWSHPLYAVPLK